MNKASASRWGFFRSVFCRIWHIILNVAIRLSDLIFTIISRSVSLMKRKCIESMLLIGMPNLQMLWNKAGLMRLLGIRRMCVRRCSVMQSLIFKSITVFIRVRLIYMSILLKKASRCYILAVCLLLSLQTNGCEPITASL